MPTTTKTEPAANDEKDAFSGAPNPRRGGGRRRREPEDTGPAPLIDFDEIAPTRPTVRFDGKLYELRLTDDFGIEKQHALKRDGDEFLKLWNSEEEDDATGERLNMLLERMFEEVLDAPRTVKAKFNDSKKARVVLAFRMAPLLEAAKAEMAAQAEQAATDPAESPTTES